MGSTKSSNPPRTSIATVAGLLATAERRVGIPFGAVDLDLPDVELLGDGDGAVVVDTVHVRGESVLGAVGDLDGLVDGFVGDHCENGAKNLLHGDRGTLPNGDMNQLLDVVELTLVDDRAERRAVVHARVEPVKVTMPTSGCSTRALPTVGPGPLSIPKAPAGRSDAATISAKICDWRGVNSLGDEDFVMA